ncbi:hypothetical protein KSF73_16390 [Burkholderiaceae bacterium DAT-1]|nr:hypothetical protein [Burkholderiaceae bacterium DAT-1]
MKKALAILTACCLITQGAYAKSDPHVLTFSPQGKVSAVQQVRVTFSESMQPFGKIDAPAPFEIDCALKGNPHWVDDKSWVMDMSEQVLNGQRCLFKLKATLKTLSGAAITGQQVFSFSVPVLTAAAINRIEEALPNDVIKENQTFILRFKSPLTSEIALACQENGQAVGAAIRLGADERKSAMADDLPWAMENQTYEAFRCPKPFQAGSKVNLVMSRGTLKPQVLNYQVRELPEASWDCPRLPGKSACVAGLPLSLRFNAAMDEQQLAAIKIETPSGRVGGRVEVDRGNVYRQSSSVLTFDRTFPAFAPLSVLWPDGLQDIDGRPLALKRRPAKLETSPTIPLAVIAAPIHQVLKASTPERTLPVLMSGGPALHASARVATLAGSNQAIDESTWLEAYIQSRKDGQRFTWGIAAEAKPLLANKHSLTREVTISPQAPQADEPRWQIPLNGKGLHIAEVTTADTPVPTGVLRDKVSVLVTNMALHLKLARESSAVWATRMDTGEPFADAQITVFDCHGKRLWRGRTASDGVALIKQSIRQDCWDNQRQHGMVVLGRHGDDVAFSSDRDTQLLNDGDWFVPGSWRSDKVFKATTVFDRVLFKPGETVSMRHLLRVENTEGLGLPDKQRMPDKLVIRHGGSNKEWTLPLSWDDGESDSTFPIPADAPLGVYSIRFEGGDVNRRQFSGNFTVAAFRLPLMLGELSAGQSLLTFGDQPRIKLALHYADGGPAVRWPVSLTATLQGGAERFTGIPDGFTSNDVDASRRAAIWPETQNDLSLLEQKLELDAQGEATLTLPQMPQHPSGYTLHLEATYADPSGEMQTLSEDIAVHPAKAALGARIVGGSSLERPMALQWVAVNEAGNRAGDMPVTVTLSRYDLPRWQQAESDPKPAEVLQVCTVQTNGNGLASCAFTPKIPGRHVFRFESRDAQGRPVRTEVESWINEREYGARPLFISADKLEYAAGDTAHLTVQGLPKQSSIWLTLEREGIMLSRVFVNADDSGKIDLPVDERWGPNVVASIMATAAGDAIAVDSLPDVYAGMVNLKATLDGHRIRVSIKPAKVRYQPGEHAQVKLHLTMPDGQPVPENARLSFVAVDESLLSLKANPTWQVLNALLQARDHRVMAVSSIKQMAPISNVVLQNQTLAGLIAAVQGGGVGQARSGNRYRRVVAGKVAPVATAMQAEMAPPPPAEAPPPPSSPVMMAMTAAADGNDGLQRKVERIEVTGSSIKPEDVEAPTKASATPRTLLDTLLTWQADVPVDRDGNAKVIFPVKDALSRFKLVAIVSANEADFGTGEAYIDVVRDVQISSGLPLHVRNGDAFDAMVTVRNAGDQSLKLQVSLSADKLDKLPTKTITLAPASSEKVVWPVKVPAGVNQIAWRMEATQVDQSGNGDVLEVRQQVEPAIQPQVQAATLEQVNGEYRLPAFAMDGVLPGSASVQVDLSSSLAGNLGGVRDWLSAYPFRCLEQRASRAVGMRDPAAWKALMADLANYQDDNGLLTYFPRDKSASASGSDMLTGYLLQLAKATGWEIPGEQQNKMMVGLAKMVAGQIKQQSWSPRDDALARKVAAMAALALYGKVGPVNVQAVRIDPDEWTSAMLIDWLDVLRHTPDLPDASSRIRIIENELRARLSYQGKRMILSREKQDYWWWLMRNGDVDAARLLYVTSDLPGWKQDLGRMVNGLLARQAHGAWLTTNANAWGTLAVSRFAAINEKTPVVGQSRIALGTATQTVDWSKADQARAEFNSVKPAAALTIRHEGAGKPWAAIQFKAAVPLTHSRYAGYTVKRTILPVKQSVPGRWHVGDVARVHLEVDAQSDMTWIAVNDPVPAGASILGGGLGRDSAVATSSETREGWVWPSYEARDYLTFQSFYHYVPRGKFTVEYTIRLNNPGSFALPPTRVEAMYAPEVFGEQPNETLVIEP